MAYYHELVNGLVDPPNDTSRSAKDLLLAIFLVRKSLLPEEICAILKSTEETYNKGKELKDSYLERTIVKAIEAVGDRSAVGNESHPKVSPNLPEGEHLSSAVLYKYSEIKHVDYPVVERFSTGIRCLDEYTNGGLGLRELSLFVAEQETGKTTLACFIGGQAQQQGYSVLHVHYEDEIGDLKPRYDEHLKDSGSDTEVYFLDATQKPIGIAGIEAHIKQTNPGLVIVDYLARIPGVNDNRFEIRDLMFKFGNLMRQYNTHIMLLDHVLIEPTRSDRQGNVLPVPYRMEMHRLSEAKMYKSMTTSIVVGMIKDRQDEKRIWVTGLKMKRKKGRSKLFQSITVDWNKGTYEG